MSSPTAEQVLRRAWAQVAEPVRERFAAGQHARRDTALPSKRFRESVLPKVINRKTVVHAQSLYVTKLKHRTWTIDDGAAAEEVVALVARHADDFAALPGWVERLLAHAAQRGSPWTKRDNGPLLGYAMVALLAHRDGADAQESIVEAFDQLLGDEVRDVDQLDQALGDPGVREELDAIVANWAPIPLLDRPTVNDERAAWDELRDRLDGMWNAVDSADEPEHIRMETLWHELVESEASTTFHHAWRCTPDLLISTAEVSVGDRHPRPLIGEPGQLDHDAAPLDRSLRQRLHGYFGAGGRKIGFAPFDVILPDAARRALDPFSLSEPRSRTVLLVAHVASVYLGEPTESGRSDYSSPFLRQMNARTYRRLAAGRHSSRLSVDALSRLATATNAFAEPYARRLWVALHNRELERNTRVVPTRGDRKLDTWAAARALMLEIASKVGAMTYEQGTAVDTVVVAEIAGGDVQMADLAEGEILLELRASLATMVDETAFLQSLTTLAAVEQFLVAPLVDLEPAEYQAQIDAAAVERADAWAAAETAWAEARRALAQRRRSRGHRSPDVRLEDVVDLLSGGNSS